MTYLNKLETQRTKMKREREREKKKQSQRIEINFILIHLDYAKIEILDKNL